MQALIQANVSIARAIDAWRYPPRWKVEREVEVKSQIDLSMSSSISFDGHWQDKRDGVHIFKKLWMKTVFVKKALTRPTSENVCQIRY